MHDIVIIGGGPGGLYAASRLAESGFDVAVLEEHLVAGEPVHCTGVLAAEAFGEFDLPRESILNSLETAEFHAPSGASIAYSTPQVEAVVVDRRVFDRVLCERAGSAGATILVGARVTDVRVSSQRVTIAYGSETIDARACVLACGASYALQRRLGLGMPSVYLQSAQIERPALNLGNVEVHFGGTVAPKGFAWVVPVRRGDRTYARIGLMCEYDARDHFDRFIARVGPRWQIQSSDDLDGSFAPRIKMLPLSPIERTYGARVLAVGDAAGLVKATTGGGIYYSVLSGRLAAEVLAAALRENDLSETALSSYEHQWRSLLGDELSAQMTLRSIANRLSDDEIDSLFELARTDGIMPIVRRTASFNRHRELILSLLSHPPARRVFMQRVLGWGQTA